MSSVVMDFRHRKTGEKRSILLEPRSLLIITKASRYDWTHGIAEAIEDEYEGKRITRGRRISVTFRNVIHDYMLQVFGLTA